MTDEDRGAGAKARKSADRLALALEDVGFDVGREFPALHGDIGQRGAPVVRMGDVEPSTVDRLAHVLWQAARVGISLPDEAGGS
jgi:hypothetical protein